MTTVAPEPFVEADRKTLRASGISVAEATRQLGLLSDPPTPFRLLRPCRPGDGITVVGDGEQERIRESFRRAADRGRASKFVPASGAASRMFRTLLSLLSEDPFPTPEDLSARERAGDPAVRDLRRLEDELARFPFGSDLVARSEEGTPLEMLQNLLDAPGLALGGLPKALVPFHRYEDGEVRTALEEHLVEGGRWLADRDGLVRLHLTVAEAQLDRWRSAVELARARLETERRRFEVTLSTQSPSTDTIALGEDGRPFRRPDGELLLRPGGHGALLTNLAATGGDLVFLKNVDNVLPEPRHEVVAHWQEVLGGLLVEIQARLHDIRRRLTDATDVTAPTDGIALLRRLEDPAADEIARLPWPDARQTLLNHLDRPVRVCGVVPNTGEPGGGPFWVERPNGTVTRQIIERAEVDGDAQREVFRSSTHFNPVQLACGLRDHRDEPFDLRRFVDPEAVFIAGKSYRGRRLRALERPGLWNGAMAHWFTIFVEVPIETFGPVKTVFDLLRPAHQPS